MAFKSEQSHSRYVFLKTCRPRVSTLQNTSSAWILGSDSITISLLILWGVRTTPLGIEAFALLFDLARSVRPHSGWYPPCVWVCKTHQLPIFTANTSFCLYYDERGYLGPDLGTPGTRTCHNWCSGYVGNGGVGRLRRVYLLNTCRTPPKQPHFNDNAGNSLIDHSLPLLTEGTVLLCQS